MPRRWLAVPDGPVLASAPALPPSWPVAPDCRLDRGSHPCAVLSAAWLSHPGVPCALPPLWRMGTPKTLMIRLANRPNQHFCVGSGRDQSEIADDSQPFTNSIKA